MSTSGPAIASNRTSSWTVSKYAFFIGVFSTEMLSSGYCAPRVQDNCHPSEFDIVNNNIWAYVPGKKCLLHLYWASSVFWMEIDLVCCLIIKYFQYLSNCFQWAMMIELKGLSEETSEHLMQKSIIISTHHFAWKFICDWTLCMIGLLWNCISRFKSVWTVKLLG